MKLLKKALCVMLAAVMGMALLSGCGGKENSESGNGQSANKDVFKVAIVQPMEHTSLNEIRDSIKAELKASMGDKVEIIDKNGNGDIALLPSIMQSLVSEGVDMIIPIATPSAQAALSATTTIPIVFSACSDPVAAGLVTDLAQTTGNITGVSDAIEVSEIFSLAKELTPNAKTFGFVYNKSEVNSAANIEKAKAYCDANGLKYKEAIANTTADIQQAAASIANDVDAFFTPDDNTVASSMSVYVQVADGAKKPIYTGADSMVRDGGTATVGINYTTLGKQTAQMAARILGGEKISDNPVEKINDVARLINDDKVASLGIEVPESIKSDDKVLHCKD